MKHIVLVHSFCFALTRLAVCQLLSLSSDSMSFGVKEQVLEHLHPELLEDSHILQVCILP